MRATQFRRAAFPAIVHNAMVGVGAVGLASVSSMAAAQVTIGGYVKADFIYDFDGKLGDTLYVPAAALDSEDVEGEFRAHARQTRLNFSADHDDYSIFVEGDFFTGDGNELVSNSRHFRIRHAFGRWGNWLAGQTWSTFMDRDFIAYPSTVDFAGPAGVSFIRQTQLRWTSGNLAIAIENPETRIADASGGAPVDQLPDLVARYAVSGNTFSWYVAGMVRRLEVEGGAADGDSETVGAAHLGAAVGAGSSSFSADVLINAGRYVYYGFNNPEAVVVGNQLESVDSYGVAVAWNQDWGNGAATTVAYGRTEFDDDADVVSALGPEANEVLETVHANYRWNTGGVSHGIEVQWGRRSQFDDQDGDDVRLQYGVRFNI